MRGTHNVYKHYALELSFGKSDIVFCRSALTERGGTTRRNIMKKTAIVTGASGGIGGSIAKRLAKDGFAVVVNYAGKPAPAQAIVADLTAAGGQGIAVQADVANSEDVERLFKESMDAFGGPDVVVHCAGIMPLFPIASGDVAAFDKVIATNLRGTFLVFAQAAQHVPEGQERRTDRRIKEDESARTARPPRRHGKSSVIPCWS